MEDRLIIVDGINNNIEEAKDFKDFVDYVKEGIDPDEGFDMDITSIALFKRVGYVKIGDETGHFKPNKYGEQIPIRKVEYINELSQPHPSDSDIENESRYFYSPEEGEQAELDAFEKGSKWMRDRMNGETEHALNDFLNGLLCRKDIHIKNPVCSNSIAESINDYLQKFRNNG